MNQLPMQYMDAMLRKGPAVIILWRNEKGRPIEYVSPNVSDFLGYPADRLMDGTLGVTDLLHADDVEQLHRTIHTAMQQNYDRFTQDNYRVKTVSGQFIWASDHTVAVRDDTNRITHYISHLMDVTANKKTEDTFQDQVKRFDMVIQGTRAGIWDWHIQTGEVIFNDRWAEIIGYSLEELQPVSIDTWVRYTHPDDLEVSNRLIEAHFSGQTQYYDCECRMKHKDGHWIWVHDRGRVTRWDAHGKPVRMTGTHIDITDRKAWEENIRREDDRIKQIIQTSLDGYFLADHMGRFVDVNQAYCNMIEYRRTELLSMGLKHVELTESPEETQRHIAYIIENGADKFLTRHRCKTGRMIDIEVSTSCLKTDGGIFFATFCRDITEKLRTESVLFENNQMLESFFKQSLDGFFFMMLDTPVTWDIEQSPSEKDDVLAYIFGHQRITKVNQAMVDQYRASESDFLGLTPNDFFAHDREAGVTMWRQMLDQGYLHVETREIRFDGDTIWIEGSYVCMYDQEGRFTGHFGIQRDVTREKEMVRELSFQEEKFRQMAENIDEVFWLRTRDEILYINPAYERMWGRKVQGMYDNPNSFIDAVHPEDRDAVRRRFQAGTGGFDMQYRIIRGDGEVRWIWARSFSVENSEEQTARSAGIAVDITERKQFEEKLEALSIRDPLTNIYNRRYIFDRLKTLLQKSGRTNRPLSLAIVDIDFFKRVNDDYGHVAGDQVLIAFARQLTDGIRPYDLLGRYGGEEFVIVFPDTPGREAVKIVDRLRQQVENTPVRYQDQSIPYTFSGGITDTDMLPPEGITVETLMETADTHLYRAKEEGRNRVVG